MLYFHCFPRCLCWFSISERWKGFSAWLIFCENASFLFNGTVGLGKPISKTVPVKLQKGYGQPFCARLKKKQQKKTLSGRMKHDDSFSEVYKWAHFLGGKASCNKEICLSSIIPTAWKIFAGHVWIRYTAAEHLSGILTWSWHGQLFCSFFKHYSIWPEMVECCFFLKNNWFVTDLCNQQLWIIFCYCSNKTVTWNSSNSMITNLFCIPS